MERKNQYDEALGDEDGAFAVRSDLAKSFAEELDAIGPLAANRSERIGDLRRRMDAACDVRELTIREWRALIEKVALARAEAPLPGGVRDRAQ